MEEYMRINYTIMIRESQHDLARLERQLRDRPNRVRVQMLRLLKSGNVYSLGDCATLLGYSPRQINRWWSRYRSGGLDALLQDQPRTGKPSQITSDAWNALQKELSAGRIRQLEDARRYLSEHWNIHYKSVNGIWWLFRRNNIRL